MILICKNAKGINQEIVKKDESIGTNQEKVLARIIMINKFNTKITPIVLLRYDLIKT